MKKPLLSLLKERYPQKKEGELYAYVLCGNVFCDGEKIRDTARKVDSRSDIEIRLKKFVSRGGYKLDGALEEWGIDCRKKIFLDAGASTGGFTDCLLQRGASLVYAVDVGYNQLDYSLRSDTRVLSREKCNIMDVEDLEPAPHMGVADLSFRSIRGAASKIIGLTTQKRLIALIKPQFEIENSEDFNGVVDDPDKIRSVLMDVARALEEEELRVLKLTPSQIKGKKGGNQEFLALIEPVSKPLTESLDTIENMISRALGE